MPTHQVKLIADTAIFAEGKILLVKYKDKNKYDHETGWFLPDDLMQYLEHPHSAAVRILHEQLKISSPNIYLNNIESFQGKDKTWHLAFHFEASFSEAPDIVTSQDIVFYDWFSLSELPQEDVAHHGWAVYTIKEIMKNRIKS